MNEKSGTKTLNKKEFIEEKYAQIKLKEYKKKFRKTNTIFLILLTILLSSNGFLLYKLNSDKLFILRKELTQNFYKKEKLQLMLKNNLGDKYEDNLKEDFNNFVIMNTSKELQQLEEKKWKPYTNFVSKEKTQIYETVKRKEGKAAEYYNLTDDIYYMKINRFVNDISYEVLEKNMKEMKKYKELIIDLRGNPGGNTYETEKIVSAFINKNDVIYEQEYNNEIKKYKSKHNQKLKFNNIVILIDGNTASSAEILTLSLKDNLNNITVMGTNSYGKGIGTTTIKFYDDSAFRYISFYWNSPLGLNIHDVGIKPDIILSENDDYVKKAVQYLEDL